MLMIQQNARFKSLKFALYLMLQITSPSSSNITILPSQWNQLFTITVQGVNDLLADGDIAYSVIFGPIVSSDASYNNKIYNVVLLNLDDDQSGITVLPTNLTTSEAGSTASTTLRMLSQPTAIVSLPVSMSRSTEITCTPSLFVFSSANWTTQVFSQTCSS